ncbi:MAG: hypothetical protein ACXVAT_19530 [Isosphaeraceae bacterium]
MVVSVDHGDGRSAYAIPARFRFLVQPLASKAKRTRTMRSASTLGTSKDSAIHAKERNLRSVKVDEV